MKKQPDKGVPTMAPIIRYAEAEKSQPENPTLSNRVGAGRRFGLRSVKA